MYIANMDIKLTGTTQSELEEFLVYYSRMRERKGRIEISESAKT